MHSAASQLEQSKGKFLIRVLRLPSHVHETFLTNVLKAFGSNFEQISIEQMENGRYAEIVFSDENSTREFYDLNYVGLV